MLAQRDHPHQEQHPEPAVEVLRLKADCSQQEVKPLVRQELAAAFLELHQVERCDLNRLQVVDPELAPLALGFLEPVESADGT